MIESKVNFNSDSRRESLSMANFATILLALCFHSSSSFTAFAPFNHENIMVSNIPSRLTSSILSQRFIPSSSSLSSSSTTTDPDPLFDQIKTMKVKEIKEQLHDAGINTSDCFEKSDLIQRLYQYKYKLSSSSSSTSSTKETKVNNNNDNGDSTIIRIPMDLHSMSTTKSIPSNNNIYLRPSPGKFPCITISLPSNDNQKLTLLVDTACSGIILRPNIASKLNLRSINTGVTMTAAGGTMNSNNNVCSIDAIQLMDADKTILKDTFVVVVQDIGSLPPALDGIVGLSFLEKFDSISFNFVSGELILFSNGSALTEYDNPMKYEIAAQTNLSKTRLGIFVASTTLDGRGPVEMIVDTGAVSSFLNWKGASDMNLDKNHPLISYNRDAIGVMGADNNALALSHRFVLKRRVNFSSDAGDLTGMFAPGLDVSGDKDVGNNGVNIDIGDLPVLDNIKEAGGILGSDILMLCDVVYLNNISIKNLSAQPKLTLLKVIEEEGL